MDPYHIVLTDDYVPFRRVLEMVLSEEPGIKVIGEAGDGLDLLRLLDQLSPDLIILDISLPKLKGIEATRWIKKGYPNTKVLILTMHSEREYLDQALRAGADGYLLKRDAYTDLLPAIETIRKGEIYISPLLSKTG
jgi:DNA-binding NarL/FixJ family response regulator